MRTDIFGLTPRQHDMFGAPEPVLDAPMSVDDIRAELNRTIAELRAADAIPWSIRRMQMVETMFPDHAARLPAGEGDSLVAAFHDEMRRLGRRAA